MTNKNLRKSLDSRNGNDIIIWSCNKPITAPLQYDFGGFE